MIERDAFPKCPACPDGRLEPNLGAAAVVRPGAEDRLACGTCNGLWLAFDDLARTMDAVTGWAADAVVVGDAPGTRTCPRCVSPMTTFRLQTAPMKQMFLRSAVTLDRCEYHGVWLDGGELHQLIGENTEALGKLRDETEVTRPIRWLYAKLRGRI